MKKWLCSWGRAACLCLLFSVPVHAEGDPRAGKSLAAVWCSACHKVTPEIAWGTDGPTFGALAADPLYTRRFLADRIGHTHRGMPNFKFFSQTQVDDLIAYILFLKRAAGEDCIGASGTKAACKGTDR